MNLFKTTAAIALAFAASAASAQTVKIGFITSYSGLNGNLGPYMERAVRLYLKLHEKELPAASRSRSSRATTPARTRTRRQASWRRS